MFSEVVNPSCESAVSGLAKQVLFGFYGRKIHQIIGEPCHFKVQALRDSEAGSVLRVYGYIPVALSNSEGTGSV